jgi:hypothetical protein
MPVRTAIGSCDWAVAFSKLIRILRYANAIRAAERGFWQQRESAVKGAGKC